MWTVLGYDSWSAYALAEFGIGRSTAYRLLDLAATAEAIEGTVTRELGVSHAWDSAGLVLPVRAAGGEVTFAGGHMLTTSTRAGDGAVRDVLSGPLPDGSVRLSPA